MPTAARRRSIFERAVYLDDVPSYDDVLVHSVRPARVQEDMDPALAIGRRTLWHESQDDGVLGLYMPGQGWHDAGR